MLVGTAAVEGLAQVAATVPAFDPAPLTLGSVVCLQVTAEMRNSARESMLPPGLHPTIPAALSIQAFSVGESPWGEFRCVTLRVSCRSGVRARGFTRATIVDREAACQGLRERLGFPATVGEIGFGHGYDRTSVTVRQQGRSILGIEAIDPEPLALGDVQYTGTLNLAHTPLGLRLMQVEMAPESHQEERLTARLINFEGAGWGDAGLAPTLVIAASVVSMDMVFPAVRFVCKPDELAFTGTEAVA